MNFTESLIEYHKSFDYKSYKAFKKALYLCKNTFNLDVEHLFLGIYYTNSEVINFIFGEKKALKIISSIEKHLFERDINNNEHYHKNILKIFYQSKILSEYNKNLVSPVLILIPILWSKNSISSIIIKMGFNTSELIKKIESDFNIDSKILFTLENKDLMKTDKV